MSSKVQTNIPQPGPRRLNSDADLTGQEGCFCKRTATGVDLTGGNDEQPYGIIEEGAAQGEESVVIPLVDGHFYRVKVAAATTIDEGDLIGPIDSGLGTAIVGVPPAMTVGQAEEGGTAGSHVLFMARVQSYYVTP